MKKKVLFALVSAMLLGFTACNSETPENAVVPSAPVVQQLTRPAEENVTADDVLGGNVQIPSPWVEHTSVEEMAAAPNFEIAFPETADGMPITYI